MECLEAIARSWSLTTGAPLCFNEKREIGVDCWCTGEAQRGGSYSSEKCLPTVSVFVVPMPARERWVIPTVPSRPGNKKDGHCGKTVFRDVSSRNVSPACSLASSGTVGAGKYYLPTVAEQSWEHERRTLWEDTFRSRSCPRREPPPAWSCVLLGAYVCAASGVGALCQDWRHVPGLISVLLLVLACIAPAVSWCSLIDASSHVAREKHAT